MLRKREPSKVFISPKFDTIRRKTKFRLHFPPKNRYGIWLHLAVVLDGSAKRVVHYVNGLPVGEKALKIKPPFRVGAAELGNWNAKGFPEGRSLHDSKLQRRDG